MLTQHRAMREIATRFVFIHSSHDTGTTRHADSRGIVVMIEGDPQGRQSIHIRRLNIWVSIRTNRIGRLIVGQQEDDIGTIFRGPRKTLRKSAGGEEADSSKATQRKMSEVHFDSIL